MPCFCFSGASSSTKPQVRYAEEDRAEGREAASGTAAVGSTAAAGPSSSAQEKRSGGSAGRQRSNDTAGASPWESGDSKQAQQQLLESSMQGAPSASTAVSLTTSYAASAAPSASANALGWNPHKEIADLANSLAGEANKLVLLDAIGQGGFGTVYRGQWRNLEVAVKTVLFNGVQGGSTGAAEAAKRAQQRAILEAAVCTSVMHPNVVTTYHYDLSQVPNSDDWKLYLIQEYCNASLHDALRKRLLHDPHTREPDMDLVMSVLRDIAQGLIYIHSKNIIHGDLTPGNVLLKQDMRSPIGVVGKITDFGLCTTMDPNKSHVSNITNGTPYYVAPEVIMHKKLTKNSDVYAFGVLMWEMYRCMPPWVKTEKGYRQNTKFRRFPSTSPRIYVALCARCLDAEPKARPPFPQILTEIEAMQAAYLAGYDSLEIPRDKLRKPEDGGTQQGQQRSVGGASGSAGLPRSSIATPAVAAEVETRPSLREEHIGNGVSIDIVEENEEGEAALLAAVAPRKQPRTPAGVGASAEANASPPMRSQAFVAYFSSRVPLEQGGGGAAPEAVRKDA